MVATASGRVKARIEDAPGSPYILFHLDAKGGGATLAVTLAFADTEELRELIDVAIERYRQQKQIDVATERYRQQNQQKQKEAEHV